MTMKTEPKGRKNYFGFAVRSFQSSSSNPLLESEVRNNVLVGHA